MENINPEMSLHGNGIHENFNPGNQMKHVPTGVKIISVLYYIGAVFSILGGVLFLFASGLISSAIGSLASLGYFAGIIFIGLGVLQFFIARGLWNGKNWARIIAIILALIGILGAVMMIIQGEIITTLFGLIVNGIIGGYLLFSKKVKEAFS